MARDVELAAPSLHSAFQRSGGDPRVEARADVALVDAQPLFSRGLELLLPAVSDSRVRVVGTTDDASLAGGLVRRCRADLALVDLGLPEPGGVRAIAAVRRADPSVPVVALAPGGQSPEPALAALRAGAVGVLEKTAEPEALVAPLLAFVEGWTVLPRGLLQHLVAESAHPASGVLSGLSPDERTLWRLLAGGATTAQLAHELHVSERTAKRLTAALLRRLRVSSRTQAAVLAGRAGLPGLPLSSVDGHGERRASA